MPNNARAAWRFPDVSAGISTSNARRPPPTIAAITHAMPAVSNVIVIYSVSIQTVCRKTLQDVNRDSGAQSPAPKHSVKNYMSYKIAGCWVRLARQRQPRQISESLGEFLSGLLYLSRAGLD